MFITLEGLDGTGKSTQARILAERLEEAGYKALVTHEPGDWSQGKTIRELLLHGDLADPRTALLLFMADRCEHIKQVVEPALRNGTIVICDRYMDSTFAYQCAKGLSSEDIGHLHEWCGFPIPDITFLLDISTEEALSRRSGRESGDTYESAGMSFMERVHKRYSILARQEERIRVIDASGAVEETANSLWEQMEQLMPLENARGGGRIL